MKTLYININNETIQSNEELEVLNYDLDSDFFFYLGEKIAKGCKVEKEKALITDFNTQDNKEDYQLIVSQQNELKTILFSEDCEGKFDFTLPNGYIHWLRFHNNEQYRSIYDKNFSHRESVVIPIDLQDLYEESVEELQRYILRKLKKDDLYCEIDEIVFNDEAVSRKSSIIRAIKDKYEGIGFKAYRKWFLEHENVVPQVCENCKKNPCECNIDSTSSDDFFPYEGITLGKTSINDIGREYLVMDEDPIVVFRNKLVNFIGLKKTGTFWGIELACGIMPPEWSRQLGYGTGTSYSECHRVLQKKKYDIIFESKVADNVKIIAAITPNRKYLLLNAFDNDTSKLIGLELLLHTCPHCKSHNCKIRIKNVDEISVYCKDCYEDYFSDRNEQNDELHTFFPICGITLGETSILEAEKYADLFDSINFCNDSGYIYITLLNSNGSPGGSIVRPGYQKAFTQLDIGYKDDMFEKWAKLGFNWHLSYNEWLELFKKRGYEISEYSIRQSEYSISRSYDNYNIDRLFKATALDYSLEFTLSFKDGENSLLLLEVNYIR